MQIVVTGGAGFIGSHLVDALLDAGHKVLVVDNLSTGDLHNLSGKSVEFLRRDVYERDTWTQLGYADAIFALACFPRSASLQNPVRDMEVNYEATIHGLEYARKNDAMFFFSSNSGIAGKAITASIASDENTEDDPTTPYDCHKLASEKLMRIYSRVYGLKTLAFRFATVYGPRQRCHDEIGWHPIVPHFIGLMRKAETPVIDGDGNQTRDFIYVDDIVSGLVAGLSKLGTHPARFSNCSKILLSTNTETSVNRVYSILAEKLHFNRPPRHGPERIADIRQMRYSNSRAQQLLGWKPKVTFARGIEQTLLT